MRAFTRRFRGNAIPTAYRSPPPVSPLWLRLQAEVEGPLALLRVATSVNAELL